MSALQQALAGYTRAGNPDFASVTAQLPFDGANGSTTFFDVKGGTFTGSGNAVLSNGQSKWGTTALRLDGTGDYLSRTYVTTSFDWWTSDFTAEMWIYPLAYPAAACLLGNMNPGTATNFWSFGIDTNGYVVFFYFNGASNFVAGSVAIGLNAWNHIMISQQGTTIRVGRAGTIDASGTRSGTPQSSNGTPLVVGQVNSICFNGYVSDLRITKGVAVYTGAYTPPQIALPNF